MTCFLLQTCHSRENATYYTQLCRFIFAFGIGLPSWLQFPPPVQPEELQIIRLVEHTSQSRRPESQADGIQNST